MKHRIYLLVIAVTGCLFFSRPLFSQTRPNVVIILADDLDDIITPQFFPEVLPVVDSMKKAGFDFNNSFVPMSICCPSRAGLLSGQYAHKNGVYRNGGENGGWDDFEDNEPFTFPARLSKQGYRTAMIGKYLNGYETHKGVLPSPPYGWTEGAVFVDPLMGTYKGYDYDLMTWGQGKALNDTVWETQGNKLASYGREASDYSTDVLREKAADFIRSAAAEKDRPFFLYLTPTSPHFPLPAAPRHEQMALDKWKDFPIPETLNSYNDFGALAGEKEHKKPKDKAPFLQKTWKKRVRQQDKGIFYYNATIEGKMPKGIRSFWQAMWLHRMGSLYGLNELIQQTITTLKESGAWDNTLLIFSSDNGFQFGNHAMQHKGTPYEESIRVPLVMIGGDSLHLQKGKTIEDWIISLDLAPTILQMAGVPVPEDLDGQSLLPFLRFGEPEAVTPFRDRFIMEYLGPGMTTDFLAKHPHFIIRMLPSYVLDQPSFHAIRMIVPPGEMDSVERIFKYIEWERYPGHLRFRGKLKHSEKTQQKIAGGNKRLNSKKTKMAAVYAELYDLTADPYEMDNLLYYLPEKYKPVADTMQAAMQEIIGEK